MKFRAALIALVFASFGMMSFTSSMEIRSEIRSAKVAAGELHWYEYINEAFDESQKTGKPIMANFTGSDWCGWCIRLHNEVFSKAEFIKWADENVVLLELDYPKRTAIAQDLKDQNAQLGQVFKVGGYPTIWMFDLKMNEENNKFDIVPIGKTGYVAGGPSEWIKGAEKILANK